MNDAIKMQISAFVDGELPQNEAELLLRRLCQDRDLRQQAAEYLAMGRVMRGERTVAGISMLRERISAALDDKAMQAEFDVAATERPRYFRPVVGVGIAATVALAALLGLQQMSNVPDADPASGSQTVADIVEDSYTVPEQDDDQLREYFLRHSATSAYFGANSINARLVTLQLREDVLLDSETAEQPVDEDGEKADSTDVVDSQGP
jgi:hypothetical protein